MKANYDHTLLLQHMPNEFQEILNHISSLKYADQPNYQVISENCTEKNVLSSLLMISVHCMVANVEMKSIKVFVIS